jgi:beta-fructofuranosidase
MSIRPNRRAFISGVCAATWSLSGVCKQRVFAGSQLGLANDPQRPQFHLLPSANWMNDPDAPVFWNGKYHMFYQYNPDGAYWGNMHWGHAVSPDMIHWKHLPIALAPTPGGPDDAGCFTGTAVIRGDHVEILYTGVTKRDDEQASTQNGSPKFHETQCLAIGSGNDLLNWEKLPDPVISSPPAGAEWSGFRDPSPWQSGEYWYTVIGSGLKHRYGVALLYRSRDLRHWEYLHPAATGEMNNSLGKHLPEEGDMWECPELFEVEGKWILIYSTKGKAFWQCGDWDSDRLLFRPRERGLLDYGCMYAPKTQRDKQGRRILWGWIKETRPETEFRAAGWAGVMSLPRIIEADDQYNVVMRVAQEFESLRMRHHTIREQSDAQTRQREINHMRIYNGCGELRCTFKSRHKACGLALEAVEAGLSKTWLDIQSDPESATKLTINGGVAEIGSGLEGLDLRLIIDGSVIEIFAGQHLVCTERIYFHGIAAPSLRPRITGAVENIKDLSVWDLAPISKDRLTS